MQIDNLSASGENISSEECLTPPSEDKTNRSGKLGKSSVGSGRTNEVGENKGSAISVPMSMHSAVKSLIKLERGKSLCPQLYAAVAMCGIYDLFAQRLDTLPSWSPETYQIKKYLQSLHDKLCSVYSIYETTDIVDSYIEKMGDLIDKVEYTFSEMTLCRELRDNLDFIELVERLLKKHKLL